MSDPDRLADRTGALAGPERKTPPSKIHLATYVSTALVAGGLLGANLHVNGIAVDFVGSPVEASPVMDPFVRFYFFRGWPSSPCMFCIHHGMRFRGAGVGVGLALVLNVVVACLILMGVAFMCELFVRRLRRAA